MLMELVTVQGLPWAKPKGRMGGHLWLLGPPAGAISFGFSIEEDVYYARHKVSYNDDFVLRNENIFTFQLTANIAFWKEGGSVKQVVKTHPGQMI